MGPKAYNVLLILWQPIHLSGLWSLSWPWALFFILVYAFILEINNYFARGKVRYNKEVRGHTSIWASRNMIWLGLMVLIFLG